MKAQPIVISVALMGGALPALAQAPQPFSVHDLNRDGYLDRQEYATFLSRFWAHQARAAHGRGPPPPMRFEEIDLNGNGLIDEQEMTWRLERRRQGRRWQHWHDEGRE